MAELDEVVQQALVHAVVDSAYGVGLVDENARFLYRAFRTALGVDGAELPPASARSSMR